MTLEQDALAYHAKPPFGKVALRPTKPFRNQRDLSLAYSPGVAGPCREIAASAQQAYQYTSKGNLVGVISNGTAVLGLGSIGALASKPVMEGKACLFKAFADVDVFDIEINETDPDKFIAIVKSLEPTFGGINLEDIKAPDCFYIESELKKQTSIPVFHDDQHGTAIISTAALLNALELTGKSPSDLKVVFSGAGAAGIACAKMLLDIGVTKDQIYIVDRKGLVTTDRPNLEPQRGAFAQPGPTQSLEQCLKGADVFIGVSSKDLVSQDMVRSMNKNPILFAMANPDPEISYPAAKEARPDIIMATGRSDYPNQVNNVLGFPFIFRGALDVSATAVTEGMKFAAAKALADLARLEVPQEIAKAYDVERLEFGPDYIIPKPLDSRVLYHVAPAVAQAAVEDGVAQSPLKNWDQYTDDLKQKAQSLAASNMST